jgi:hypothetical protein
MPAVSVYYGLNPSKAIPFERLSKEAENPAVQRHSSSREKRKKER